MDSGDPLEGRVVAGRYRLGPVLGRGGMADVRQAEDERLGRPVAVKFLNATLASQPELRRRFEDEARAAARLSHPAVVQVFDSGEWEGHPFLVMEKLSGRTLASEMAAGPLPVERVRAVAADVLGALAAAHASGIVHRDIKPGNLLVTSDGSVKVSDFGIAKADPLLGGDDVTGPPPTMTGQVLGTPSYLAPERLAGRPATAASDVWALGVVCWEALAGRRAYPEGTALQVAMAVMHTDLDPIESVRPDTDPWLAQAIDGALQRDPHARWPSATAMREVLLTGNAPPGFVAAPAPTTQLLAAGAIGAGAAATGTATRTPSATDAITTGPGTTVYGAPRPPRSGPGGVLAVLAAVLLVAIAIVAALLIRQRRADNSSGNPPVTTVTTAPAPPSTTPQTTAVPPTTVPATAPPTTSAPTTTPPTTLAPTTSVPATTSPPSTVLPTTIGSPPTTVTSTP